MNFTIKVNPEFYNNTEMHFYNRYFKLVDGDLIIYSKYFIFFKYVEMILSKDSWFSVQNISY